MNISDRSKSDKLHNKSYIVYTCIALVHLLITLATDRSIFIFPERASGQYAAAMADYIICKLLTFVILFFLYRSLFLLIFDRGSGHNRVKGILMSALPYLAVIIVVLIIKLPAGYISNDENAIYNNAVTLTHDTWFYYLTTYYYIVSLMLMPFKYGPIMVKVLIQLLTVGYVVYRLREYFGKRAGMWGYLLFLMYPVIAYTTSAHRLPVYFLIYLMLFVKLLFDGLENAKCPDANSIDNNADKDNAGRKRICDVAIVLLAGSLLTQWRTEGIYLAVLIPILCLFVYPYLRSKRNIVTMLVAWLLLQYVISVPQNGFTASNLDAAANDRMKPFYAYTITNMYRNGLDLEKNKEDLAIVDKYLSLDVIKAINEHYVDINYEDVLILYQDGFVGVRPEATVEDFVNYSDAVKRIFVNNPDVFIRTRIGAFDYAARPFHISFTGTSVRELISFAVSVVKSFFYNLYIPSAICLILCIYSLIRRRWYSFFTFGGLIAHWVIVFVLAPASYFKYYFPVYIMAYFYVFAIAICLYLNRKGETIRSILM